MGACNTIKHKHFNTEINKSLKPVTIKQDKISDKTIFDGLL